MRSSQLLLAILMGCTQDEGRDQGTVVGNPGDAALRMGAVDAGEVITARTTVSAMSLETCTGTVTEFALGDEVDFLDDGYIEIPNGTWCALTLFAEDSLFIEAISDDEKTFLTLDLALAVLEFDSAEGFSVEGDQAILEWGFPGWLSMESEALVERLDIEEDDIAESEEEEDVLVIEIGPEDDGVHDDLVDVFAFGSGLYGDDGDGRLSDEERRDALWAAGADHPVESDEEAREDEPPVVDGGNTMGGDARLATGPGCAKSESSLQWAVVVPLMLLGLRREQDPR